jgi:hypothetical protein
MDLQASYFQPFIINFENYKINCIKLLRFNIENSMKIYRGIDFQKKELFNVYEFQINYENNGVLDNSKLEYCQTQVT